MSNRRVALNVDDRIAQLEEFVRRIQGDSNVSPTDTRYLYDRKGDVLFATDSANPLPLHLPTSHPASSGAWVISASPSSPIGVDWVFLGGGSSGGTGSGGGSSGGGGGGGASGAAGGVLSGAYPDPGFAVDMATQVELDAHITDSTDAHDASAVSFIAGGSIASTNVQTAVAEVATDYIAADAAEATARASADMRERIRRLMAVA